MQKPRRDFSPAKRVSIGWLVITVHHRREYHLWLYQTQEPPGAFSIGPTFERRVYYRGGDSKELVREMESAYFLAMQQCKVL